MSSTSEGTVPPVKPRGKTRGTGRPTIRDVSQLAGVSRMTVSRVISDPDLVLPATREKVLKAVADLGYVPDRVAGSLSSRRTGFVALMLPTLTNANFAAVAQGLTEQLREADYQLLIAYTEYNQAEEERQLNKLLARRPEAIVMTGASHTRNAARMLMQCDVPVIEIADLPSQPIDHSIGFSNYEVGRTAARHLIERGFTRIGAVGGSQEAAVRDHRGEERMRGFEDELRFSGLATDLVLRHGSPPLSYDHGAAAIAILLKRDPGIQAVFAVSDLSAVGVLMECQRRHVPVPDKLSVMGFGNFEIGGEVNPPLTTVNVNFRALGQRTGALILELLGRDGDTPPHIEDIGLSIIERASVGRVK
ncbi:substrate-binding domain-containing protein [Novosphingobium sp. FSY-8]|uniref:Substrate-binding domain-containing protein n=1 Tax=Novosphingobium ovatum TaxID=1908523 RepID=A0ABW9XDL9_9SPHN|nr:LacI family DNA-binding transcriptional regulator [Novosphingobium ovatum]NBC36633.1 substrate-binding domain-containing protein [Novosphingobium ovatum]